MRPSSPIEHRPFFFLARAVAPRPAQTRASRVGTSVRSLLVPLALLVGALSANATGLVGSPVSGHVPAQAAAPSVALSRLEVALWPEYDRPDMLVIYRATLAGDTDLPTQVRFEIPAAAGPPNAVAGADASGRLVNLDYERRVEGDQASIVFTASRPELQIEYYDPALERDGARRAFSFVWPGEHPVEELSVQIQRPVGARELTVTPEAASRGVADDGLLYAEVALGRVPAGESRRVDLQYLKPDDGLSATALAETPPAGDSADSAADPLETGLPLGWIVGGVALLLAAGLAVFLLMRRSGAGERAAGADDQRAARPSDSPPSRRPPGGERAAKEDADTAGAGSRFCTQCGAPAEEGDRFCHACGSSLR